MQSSPKTKCNDTTKTQETFNCEYCKKDFKREKSFVAHQCPTKQRMANKDTPVGRIAFLHWQDFYRRSTQSTKPKTYLDFAKSTFYTAFCNFTNYCIETKVVRPDTYMKWLLDQKVGIDQWGRDTNYTKYILWLQTTEDAMDAVKRSVTHMMELCDDAGTDLPEFFTGISANRICYTITAGRLSPWVLYQSASGLKFLEALSEPQEALILDYINPDKWALVFHRRADEVTAVRNVLQEIGL